MVWANFSEEGGGGGVVWDFLGNKEIKRDFLGNKQIWGKPAKKRPQNEERVGGGGGERPLAPVGARKKIRDIRRDSLLPESIPDCKSVETVQFFRLRRGHFLKRSRIGATYILINFQNANAPKLRINAHVEKLWEHSGIYNSKPSLKASLDSPQGGANIDSEIPVDLYKEIIS